MNKKIIALAISCIVGISIIGCSNNNASTKGNSKTSELEEKVELSGKWSSDYNREEVNELFTEGLQRVEEVCENYYLEYNIAEDITSETKDDKVISINDNHIYLDNENPEPNRLESMYYGFKQFGSDLASGQIIMKLGFNLDRDLILSEGEFNFEDTSLAVFSQAFTGEQERDYSNINSDIYDIIANNKSGKTIENNLDGIKETIIITDNYLLYKLETKEYSFK